MCLRIKIIHEAVQWQPCSLPNKEKRPIKIIIPTLGLAGLYSVKHLLPFYPRHQLHQQQELSQKIPFSLLAHLMIGQIVSQPEIQ